MKTLISVIATAAIMLGIVVTAQAQDNDLILDLSNVAPTTAITGLDSILADGDETLLANTAGSVNGVVTDLLQAGDINLADFDGLNDSVVDAGTIIATTIELDGDESALRNVAFGVGFTLDTGEQTADTANAFDVLGDNNFAVTADLTGGALTLGGLEATASNMAVSVNVAVGDLTQTD